MNKSYQSLCDVFAGDRRTTLLNDITHRYRWSEAKASQAVDEYVMFLYIASLNIGVQLVPTQEIDCVWETDILQSTERYMQTCQIFCGQVIHHAGAAEMAQVLTPERSAAAFARTRTLFEQYFGEDSLSEGTLAAACGLM